MTKQDKKFYLYLKESPKGLKYLGFTTQNPYLYRGSGKYWKSHLNFHKIKSSEIATTILFQTYSVNRLKKKGLYYSSLWNVKDSKEFANLIPENGQSSVLGHKWSDERKKKFSMYKTGSKMSDETKIKIRNSRLGKKLSKKSRLKVGLAISKHILQFDKDLNFIKEWSSVTEASKTLNLSRTSISMNLINKQKSSGGFIWKYKTK